MTKDLNNHHRDTLAALHAHPVSHNIRWVDAVSLAAAVGDVEDRHDGRVKITIGGQAQVFDRPHGKDLDTQQVLDLRHMFDAAGYTAPSHDRED